MKTTTDSTNGTKTTANDACALLASRLWVSFSFMSHYAPIMTVKADALHKFINDEGHRHRWETATTQVREAGASAFLMWDHFVLLNFMFRASK